MNVTDLCGVVDGAGHGGQSLRTFNIVAFAKGKLTECGGKFRYLNVHGIKIKIK